MSSLLRGSIFTGDLNLINFYFESYMKKEARQIFVNSVANCSLFARKLETILGTSFTISIWCVFLVMPDILVIFRVHLSNVITRR